MDSKSEIVLKADKLYYWFEDTENPFLQKISFDVKKGEFILIVGASGSGKSTLLKCLNGIIPHLEAGDIGGSVEVAGLSTATTEPRYLSKHIGSVFQNPDDQIVSFRVCDEVAWGLENHDYERDKIIEKVNEYLDLLHIRDLINRLTTSLSGGQKQKVVIAANLAMEQGVLLFDDPTTDLDPVSKNEVVISLDNIRKKLDVSYIIVEHDLTDLIEIANRIIVMDKGKIIYDGQPKDVLQQNYPSIKDLGILLPDQVELGYLLYKNGYPFSVKKAEIIEAFYSYWQSKIARYVPPVATPKASEQSEENEVVVEFKDVCFGYDKNKTILNGLNLQVHKGEFLSIIGQNGSGKSTIAKLIVGLLKAKSGQVSIMGKNIINSTPEEISKQVGYCFQNPDHQLFLSSIREELMFGLKQRNMSSEEAEKWMKQILKIVGLEGCEDLHPFSLSRGARQKLAVATVLVNRPEIIVLDEPTTGQDKHTLVGLLDLMKDLIKESGSTVIMITHDMEVVAEYATRVIAVSDGNIVSDGSPKDIYYSEFEKLSELYLRPPFIVELVHNLIKKGVTNIPKWLTVNECVGFLEKAKSN
ncbi:MAG: ABC transporter ATP-binding protein [Clostridiales bacterium]|nr:ABC transporter ATP-binding protein [Clostridiales bacterium]